MFNLTISQSGRMTYLVTSIACILFVLPLFRKNKATFGSEMESRLFSTMIIFFLIHVITDAVMVTYREPGPVNLPVWVRYINTVFNEQSISFLSFFWFLFGTVRLGLHQIDQKKFKRLISIPMLCELVLSLTSPFTGLLFTLNGQGIYQRGSLYFLQVICIFSYLIAISVIAVIRSSKETVRSKKAKDLSLVKFIIAPVIASIFQIMAHNTPIMMLGLTIGIYYVYIDILDMQVFNDSLTGLNNRRRAEYYLLDCLDNAETRPFCVFMIDVDYSKRSMTAMVIWRGIKHSALWLMR
jgi:hypothetical protein